MKNRREFLITIIGGYGGMGSLMARVFLEDGHSVVLAGPNPVKGKAKAKELGGKTRFEKDNRKAVSNADIVIITVPMEATSKIISEIAPHVKEGALLTDLTSVKQEPCRLMAENSKKGVEVVGCHPIFGPRLSNITGQAFILCPVRGEKWFLWLKEFLESKKAKVFTSTPENHDHTMAVIQGLTHFSYISFGKTLDNLGFNVRESRNFSSPVYDMMLDMVGRILGQNPNLYAEIQMENPEIPKIHEAFLKAASELSGYVKAGDRSSFVKYMRAAAVNFGDVEEAMGRSDKATSALVAELEWLKHSVGKEICLKHIYSKTIHFGRLIEVSADEVVLEDKGKKTRLKSSNLKVIEGGEETDFLREKFGITRRDYSYIFPNAVDERLVSDLAKDFIDILMCDIKDVYTGKGVNEECKSVCFSVEFLQRDVKERDVEISSFFERLGGTRR
ncbi:MAG: prephenate dehydrogenase [Candidatus Altiarchaeota archaeon]